MLIKFKKVFQDLSYDSFIFYISNCNVPYIFKNIFIYFMPIVIYFHDTPLCGSFKSGLILYFKNEF